jgi:SpoVK/Ycf46/Vps4 family AAA+-type ATPase
VARALAAHAGRAGKKVSFFMRKGADVLSKWVGEAERQLRLLFEEAQRHQPSIIFFDEIDGLAPVSNQYNSERWGEGAARGVLQPSTSACLRQWRPYRIMPWAKLPTFALCLPSPLPDP